MSRNKNIFNQVEVSRPTTNAFDLTHDVKMSGKMGNLYPVMSLETLPGDKVILGCDMLLRFAPLLAPIMHRVDVSVHYFFVPNRLLWDGWEPFIVNSPDAEAMPYFDLNGLGPLDPEMKFLDYFGIPPVPNAYAGHQHINALPVAAYQKIYDDWYRDENLIDPVIWKLESGENDKTDFLLMRKRAWEHDYFTASLPFAQKGAAVDIPLGDVTLKDDWADGTPPYPFFEAIDGSPADVGALSAALTVGPPALSYVASVSNEGLAYDPQGSLQVQATTINDLRRAFKLQEWLEKNARGGTRYVESNLVHFGVRSSDQRLQRSEYITGVKAPVVISEVLNSTGVTQVYDGTELVDTGSPQGDMAGHAVSVTSGKSGSYRCEEHGYVIGMLSVLPKTAYQQGIPKHFLKNDFLDYAFPTFGHLGEQEVAYEELLAYKFAPGINDLWGYVPRYAEYKYLPSRVAGDFRTTLDFWHLGRIFDPADPPFLNQEFIECDPDDVSRIFAVQTADDNLWMHLLHRVKAIRPLPYFGTPSI